VKRHYPFIDYSTGGNIKGMIKAAAANLVRVTEKTIVIPGHGKIGGKQEMTEYRNMLVAIYNRVAALKKEANRSKKLSQRNRPQPTTASGLALLSLATSSPNKSTSEPDSKRAAVELLNEIPQMAAF
jgi:hypothetical protein